MTFRTTPKRRLLAAAAAVALAVSAQGATGAQDDLGALLAAEPAAGGFDGVPDYVAVRVYLDRDAYHAGDEVRIAVEMRIDPKVHINGDVPTLDFQVPTEITWDELPAGVKASAITWPKAKMAAFEFTDGKKIAVFEGTQRAFLTIKLPQGAPGTHVITGTFRAQGCTHETCYAPQKDALKITVRVVPAGEETQPVNEEKFAPPKKAEGDAGEVDGVVAAASQDPDEPASGAPMSAVAAVERDRDLDCKIAATANDENVPLLLKYVIAFFTGLVLTLTPCVLPLVPITIGYFSRQSEGGGQPITMSTLYVLGLATVYSTLGTVAALSGSLFGAALQSPWVIGGIAVILTCLALSMFGILPDLQLPSSLQSKLGGGRTGRFGAFFMGGAMGLIAAPCVGPGVVSLLTFVAKLGAEMSTLRAALLGGSLFFVLSLGLGAPFFLVGMGAASIRPGPWMVTVKKVFGFAILGVALWFLRPLIGNTAFAVGLLLVLGAAALFLFRHAPEGGARGLRLATQGIAAVAAIGAIATALVLTGAIKMPGVDGRTFTPYAEEHLVRARAEGRPVVIDFGAEWCTLCKEIEHEVFPAPQVQALFADFVLLRADMTESEDATVMALREKFRVVGLPTIVFLDSSGREIEELRLTGPETPEGFAERLRCVTAYQVAER